MEFFGKQILVLTQVGAKVALAGFQSEETGFPEVPAADTPVLMDQQP